MRRIIDTRNQVSYPENYRIIELPLCTRCKKVAPECTCGRNAARQKKEDD